MYAQEVIKLYNKGNSQGTFSFEGENKLFKVEPNNGTL